MRTDILIPGVFVGSASTGFRSASDSSPCVDASATRSPSSGSTAKRHHGRALRLTVSGFLLVESCAGGQYQDVADHGAGHWLIAVSRTRIAHRQHHIYMCPRHDEPRHADDVVHADATSPAFLPE